MWRLLYGLGLVLGVSALPLACQGKKSNQAVSSLPSLPMDTIRARDGALMVKIPAGEFVMGSPGKVGAADEHPLHRVWLDEYYVDVYEVTNAQYRIFCDATGHPYPRRPDFKGVGDYFLDCPNHPVTDISWEDAEAYAVWAGKQLPTEAEWEKAARGTDARTYPWGDSVPDGTNCNFADRSYSTLPGASWADRSCDDGFVYPAPVGSFRRGASPYGVQDMAGNVWEMVADGYAPDYYRQSPKHNPTGPSKLATRLARGGSYTSTKEMLRCARRLACTNLSPMPDRGFRCVLKTTEVSR